jgi:predicted kinase
MPKLIMLSAPSASGKSTLARQMMEQDGNAVRINRDDLREMSITKWKPSREDWIIKSEIALCKVAAGCKKNIIIDDTNLSKSDEDRWQGVAKEIGYTFEKIKLEVDLEECIARDARRAYKSIGRPAIERQFLKAGLWKIPASKKTVIFDIDGTLADLTHRVPWITIGATCPNCVEEARPSYADYYMFQNGNMPEPFEDIWSNGNGTCKFCEGTGKIVKKWHDAFYSLCSFDTPIDIVVRWLRACYEDYHVLIVSGRSPEKGGERTIGWLSDLDCPYHHILMRRANCHGPDDEEKQLILDMILKIVPKEDIAFVVDDRKSVVDMWRRNGLTVYPVRGRDDDKFYEIMNDLEATHPRPELADETIQAVQPS